MYWLAGVSPRASGNWKARMPKAIATAVCRPNFTDACRPSERALLILIQSSAKPTIPRQVNRPSASMLVALGWVKVTRCATA